MLLQSAHNMTLTQFWVQVIHQDFPSTHVGKSGRVTKRSCDAVWKARKCELGDCCGWTRRTALGRWNQKSRVSFSFSFPYLRPLGARRHLQFCCLKQTVLEPVLGRIRSRSSQWNAAYYCRCGNCYSCKRGSEDTWYKEWQVCIVRWSGIGWLGSTSAELKKVAAGVQFDSGGQPRVSFTFQHSEVSCLTQWLS